MKTDPPLQRPSGILGMIEWVGNKLPDPVILFAIGAVLVALMSAIAAQSGWTVQPVRPVPAAAGADHARVVLEPIGEPIRAKSILSADGAYWAMSSAVKNFIAFPPLGMVLVSMLGIGVSEKVGMFAAVVKWLATLVPSRLLTPTVIFLGMMTHIGTDAGFIILPPLAAAMFVLAGRSPLAGIAAAFAGVGGGFSANLLISPSDAIMASLTSAGAQVLDPSRTVAVTCNWWFLIASTFLLTVVGWAVTSWIIEPRLATRPAEEGGPAPAPNADDPEKMLTPQERSGLAAAAATLVVLLGIILAMALVPGWPLHGLAPATGQSTPPDRWTQAIVPIIFVLFLGTGIAYGLRTGSIRGAADVSRAFAASMASMAPVIVMAFFAAQFIEYLKYSQLDRMLAFTGGEALVKSGLSATPLMIALVLLTAVFNMCIASMSAKWSMLATILVPMLMIAGISPELSQAAYRIGDSVTNTITPLNPYMIIILVAAQRYHKSAGTGSIISLLMPYAVAFLFAWLSLLMFWMMLGVPLGPGGPLRYVPQA
ncbi:MAG: AbgT family transporter [Planctomycetes bacterium]|nr:AbgT family transporter [Planctomycetota bacterium]